MKLWHDDVRPPPEGWEWARTNETAKLILLTGWVRELSLDHDMGYDGPPPEICEECFGTGRILVGDNDHELSHSIWQPCRACDGDGFEGGDIAYKGGTTHHDGRELAVWIAEQLVPRAVFPLPEKIAIHSNNHPGIVTMKRILEKAGLRVHVEPYRL